MQELRFVAVSEDGRYAVLAVPGRSARFTLPIDERLRAVALGQTSRLAQYEIEVESPLRPKEIQARIRAGETVEEIADAAGIAVERVRWFEGPVLAERAYVAEQAQTASVRRPGESTPGPRLGEITAERLSLAGADPDDVQWDARKRGDGNWQVQLTFTTGGRLHVAEWLYDPRRRHVIPSDDAAARMSLPGSELPEPVSPGHGEATVTRLAPRLRHDPPAPVTPPPAAAAAAGPLGAPPSAYSGATTFSSADQHRYEPPAARSASSREASSREASSREASSREAEPREAASVPARETTEAWEAAPERPADPETATPREAVASAQPAPTAPTAPVVAATAPPAPAVVEPAVAAAAQSAAILPTAAATEPATTEPTATEPATSQPSATAPATAPPAAAQPATGQPAASASGQPVTAQPVTAQPVTAQPVTAQPVTAQPVTAQVPSATAPPATPPMGNGVRRAAAEAAPAPAADAPTPPAASAESTAPAAPASGANADTNGEQPGRPGRKNARGRRSSVPSWDEIMLGSSRQRD